MKDSQAQKKKKIIKWEYYHGIEKDLKEYFNNIHDLDPIEGTFSISHKIYNSSGRIIDQKDNYVTLAIIKDSTSLNREFIEINLQEGEFPKYAITAEFTKAASGLIYLSKQYFPNGDSENENFVWDNELGMLLSEKTQYYKGQKLHIKRYYLKIYPKNKNISTSKNNTKFYGTCFAISKEGYFLTNYHVIENGKKISIQLKDNLQTKEYVANVILKDEANDIAILKVIDSTFSYYNEIPYRLIEKSKIGERIFTMGYPITNIMGVNLKYTDGSISALSGIKDDIRYFQMSVPIQPGNSGGPVFNKSGNIIGIVTAKLNGGEIGVDIQNVNYAIKAQYIFNICNMLPLKPDIISPIIHKNENFGENMIESLNKYIGLVVSIN